MKKLDRFIYWLTGYDKFQTRSVDEKLSDLFWAIWEIFLVLIALTLALSFRVNAEGTYSEYTANDCAVLGSSNVESIVLKSTVSGRVVSFVTNNNTAVYFVSEESGIAYLSSRNFVTCNTPNKSLYSVTVGQTTYYYYSNSFIGPTFNMTIPVVGDFNESSAALAVYYTYGEGAASGPTYDNFCSTECRSFYQNPNNSRYGNVQFSSNVRGVFFNDSFYAVSLNSFTAYIGSTSASPNPASCGTNQANIRTNTYDGVDFYFISFSKSSFNWYGNSSSVDVSGTAALAYRYTFGDLAVAPSYNVCNFDYSPVRHIYPTENNYDIASFSTTANGNYDQVPDANYLGLYFTRYDKELDALYAYRLIFEDTVNYPIVYSVSDSTLSVTFNNNIFSSTMGITSIYDESTTDFFSPTNHLSQLNSYLDSSNWNTYNIAYPNIHSASHIAHSITQIFTNTTSRNVYSDFEIPSSLTFDIINTNYSSLVEGENIKFFRTSVDSELYYDYYVILNFRSNAFSDVLSGFYNGGNTYSLVNDEKVLNPSYYSIIPYLNQKMMFENYNSDNDVQDIDDYINGTVDEDLIPQFGPDYVDKNINFTEEEYITTAAVDAFDRLFQSLAELAKSAAVDNQTLLNLINSNTTYFFNCLTSFDNPFLHTNTNFISNQLDWMYNNTVFKVPVNIALVGAVIWAVIF